MELYLSGSVPYEEDWNLLRKEGCLFLLQTFYEMRKWEDDKIKKSLYCCKKFMLDSGAFTFMNSGVRVDWKQYVDDYCDFINKWDIQQFIELDLYGILGIENTEKIRKYIERRTGKKPIPVYHGTLPVSYFRKLCNEYPYIALSATGRLKSSKWTNNKKALKQMIRIAHSYGTKVHGLGYTKLVNLNTQEIPFYSVDSTVWLNGARFGFWYYMKHGILKRKNCAGMGIHPRKFNDNNLRVWIIKQKQLFNKN